MELQALADLINETRRSDLLLTLNSGKELRLTPEAVAVHQQDLQDLYILWPIDGDLTKVRKGMLLAPANVSTAEFVPPEGQSEAA